ncbi:hypothetical protein C8R44DRAFT_745646 [Mycena epipterygia]|nr:hypothetical protein C8R44DRAFT_745646 [Mycena epipterygia]
MDLRDTNRVRHIVYQRVAQHRLQGTRTKSHGKGEDTVSDTAAFEVARVFEAVAGMRLEDKTWRQAGAARRAGAILGKLIVDNRKEVPQKNVSSLRGGANSVTHRAHSSSEGRGVAAHAEDSAGGMLRTHGDAAKAHTQGCGKIRVDANPVTGSAALHWTMPRSQCELGEDGRNIKVGQEDGPYCIGVSSTDQDRNFKLGVMMPELRHVLAVSILSARRTTARQSTRQRNWRWKQETPARYIHVFDTIIGAERPLLPTQGVPAVTICHTVEKFCDLNGTLLRSGVAVKLTQRIFWWVPLVPPATCTELEERTANPSSSLWFIIFAGPISSPWIPGVYTHAGPHPELNRLLAGHAAKIAYDLRQVNFFGAPTWN